MATQVVLSLPDELYRRAEGLARLVSRDVTEVLADAIALSLPSFTEHSDVPRPAAELSDGEILELADAQLAPGQDRRLSVLLDKQQRGALAVEERSELASLMQVYQERLLRKAQALNEAVRRGLRQPLDP
jgi:predicted transcriptional regulator